MTPIVRRAVAATVTAAALIVTTACGSSDSGSSDAQQNLKPPLSAHSSEPSTPVSLTLAGATAPTTSVATDVSGALLPPQDVSKLGWWVDSSLPGSGAGTVVVTGHVDDVNQGAGFAAKFADLKVGDTVEVTTTDGGKHTYRVTSTDHKNKEGSGSSGLPTSELNRQDGPETLALVTCGGPFVGPPLGYRDNVVVFATPV
ncbi:class F sortase [Gordonia spumicola]|uniref:Class F sortase n=1 Tax=Gordonia spumicola TaxID=589161 RepID=A0A7I9VBP6_9ACTN|nr:class F sortase [Gordonia spumicola]GEE02786.1 class F sortase [Gordonia spumicola]